ncbi:Protein of unknown function, partial [Cotesia congregata]
MKNRTDVNDFTKILVGCLSDFAATVTRSAISKSVLSDDLGKVFSVVTFIETILPLGSAPLYTLVYSSYIADYPTPSIPLIDNY